MYLINLKKKSTNKGFHLKVKMSNNDGTTSIKNFELPDCEIRFMNLIKILENQKENSLQRGNLVQYDVFVTGEILAYSAEYVDETGHYDIEVASVPSEKIVAF